MEPTVSTLQRMSSIEITVQFPQMPPNSIRAVKEALEDAHRDDPWVVQTDEYTDDLLRVLQIEKRKWNGGSGEEVVATTYLEDGVPDDRLKEYAEYAERLAVSVLELLSPNATQVFAEIEHKDVVIASLN